MIIQECWC